MYVYMYFIILRGKGDMTAKEMAAMVKKEDDFPEMPELDD